MNKHRDKSNRNLKTKKEETPFAFEKKRLFQALFLIIILLSIALKIYKADYAGIAYDESLTFQQFSQDVETALTSYTPNNHVLNSIFIHYAHKFFGFYEHFVRIPSLLAGIVFSLSIAYIVYKSIESDLLRITAFAMISLVPFVFDYSFLARGYAFSFGYCYAQIAFVLWLLEHKIRFKYWLIPAFIISLLNFINLGAMISTVLMLAAINAAFVLFYSHKIFKDNVHRLKTVILNSIAIFIFTSVPLFFLYRQLYTKIMTNSTVWKWDKVWKGWPSLTEYMHGLLITKVFHVRETFGLTLYYIFLFFVILGIIFYICKLLTAIKAGTWRKCYHGNIHGNFVMITGLLGLVIIVIYATVLKKSLGFQRNNAYLIPLVLTCCVIILDRFGNTLKGILGKTVRVIIVVVVLLTTLHNLPNPYRWGGSTFSKPVLQRLRAIDPDKTWNIAFSERKRLFYMGFLYYKQFDYKFNTVKQGKYDVFICHKNKRPSGAVCLDWDYFEKAGIAVVLNTALPADRVALDVKLIEN